MTPRVTRLYNIILSAVSAVIYSYLDKLNCLPETKLDFHSHQFSWPKKYKLLTCISQSWDINTVACGDFFSDPHEFKRIE